jgi:nucleoside-diphosphate-sugar epimerase
MSLDQTLHSLFGASKVAADILVQGYGRYYGLKTAAFRAGCITGSGHSGAELHGFLNYLVHCAVAATPYTIFGYKAKQVRDNIHATDLVHASNAASGWENRADAIQRGSTDANDAEDSVRRVRLVPQRGKIAWSAFGWFQPQWWFGWPLSARGSATLVRR